MERPVGAREEIATLLRRSRRRAFAVFIERGFEEGVVDLVLVLPRVAALGEEHEGQAVGGIDPEFGAARAAMKERARGQRTGAGVPS